MSLAVSFHPEAESELRAEARWYDDRREGLGERFEAAVASIIESVLLWPESGQVWSDLTREPVIRSRGVTDFPYRLVYFVTAEELMVVAVAHEKRKPGYWRDRVRETA